MVTKFDRALTTFRTQGTTLFKEVAEMEIKELQADLYRRGKVKIKIQLFWDFASPFFLFRTVPVRIKIKIKIVFPVIINFF